MHIGPECRLSTETLPAKQKLDISVPLRSATSMGRYVGISVRTSIGPSMCGHSDDLGPVGGPWVINLRRPWGDFGVPKGQLGRQKGDWYGPGTILGRFRVESDKFVNFEGSKADRLTDRHEWWVLCGRPIGHTWRYDV